MLLGESRRFRRFAGILLDRLGGARRELVDDAEHELRTERGQPRFERGRVFVRIDRRPLLREARTGVEAGRHLDHRVAGFGFAVQDRTLDGRRAAILGQAASRAG